MYAQRALKAFPLVNNGYRAAVVISLLLLFYYQPAEPFWLTVLRAVSFQHYLSIGVMFTVITTTMLYHFLSPGEVRRFLEKRARAYEQSQHTM